MSDVACLTTSLPCTAGGCKRICAKCCWFIMTSRRSQPSRRWVTYISLLSCLHSFIYLSGNGVHSRRSYLSARSFALNSQLCLSPMHCGYTSTVCCTRTALCNLCSLAVQQSLTTVICVTGPCSCHSCRSGHCCRSGENPKYYSLINHCTLCPLRAVHVLCAAPPGGGVSPGPGARLHKGEQFCILLPSQTLCILSCQCLGLPATSFLDLLKHMPS